MSPRIKIIVGAVNIACLIATLMYPDNVTPYALLMTIVSSGSWAFTSNSKDESSRGKCLLYSFVIISSILAIICIFLGVTANIYGVDANNTIVSTADQVVKEYYVHFNNRAFLLGGVKMSYTPVATGMLIAIVALTSGEIIYTPQKKDQDIQYSHSIASYINKQLDKIQ